MTFEQKIALGVGSLQALATFLVAYVLYRQTEKLKRIELTKQAIDAYNLLNSVAVSRDKNLLSFDALGRQNIDEPIEARRKRWCAFIWLESLQVTFLTMKYNLIDRAYAEQALRQQLEVILNDDLVYQLLCERGFDPAFVQYAKPIREQLQRLRTQTSQGRGVGR